MSAPQSPKAVARHDAVEPSRQRRQPAIERESENKIITPYKRALACNVGRDLERNFAAAKAIINQFRQCVVGSLGKLQVNLPNDVGREASDWFNGVWSRDVDMLEDGTHFSVDCQNVVAAWIREGDFLTVFDDGVLTGGKGEGKLRHWEADQVVPAGEKAFAVIVERNKLPAGCVQDSGIVRDGIGRVLGWLATGERGQTMVDDPDKITFFPRSVARLSKQPWRFNQGRAVPAILASATNFQDLLEILVKELASAKRAAGQYGFVKRENAVTDWESPGSSPELLPENNGKTAAEVALEGANAAVPTLPNYENLEAYTGGYTDYLAKGDEVVFPPIDRPNVHLAEFIEAVLGHAGASMGLARAYTVLRADSSYTAFRGDMVLTWNGAFYPTQKQLERQHADWVGVRAIRWAIATGAIKALPAGWETRLSWQWPTMPSVDEAREQDALTKSFRNLDRLPSEVMGPDWRRRMDAAAEQMDYARAKGLPFAAFETASGAALNESQGGQGDQKNGRQ